MSFEFPSIKESIRNAIVDQASQAPDPEIAKREIKKHFFDKKFPIVTGKQTELIESLLRKNRYPSPSDKFAIEHIALPFLQFWDEEEIGQYPYFKEILLAQHRALNVLTRNSDTMSGFYKNSEHKFSLVSDILFLLLPNLENQGGYFFEDAVTLKRLLPVTSISPEFRRPHEILEDENLKHSQVVVETDSAGKRHVRRTFTHIHKYYHLLTHSLFLLAQITDRAPEEILIGIKEYRNYVDPQLENLFFTEEVALSILEALHALGLSDSTLFRSLVLTCKHLLTKDHPLEWVQGRYQYRVLFDDVLFPSKLDTDSYKLPNVEEIREHDHRLYDSVSFTWHSAVRQFWQITGQLNELQPMRSFIRHAPSPERANHVIADHKKKALVEQQLKSLQQKSTADIFRFVQRFLLSAEQEVQNTNKFLTDLQPTLLAFQHFFYNTLSQKVRSILADQNNQYWNLVSQVQTEESLSLRFLQLLTDDATFRETMQKIAQQSPETFQVVARVVLYDVLKTYFHSNEVGMLFSSDQFLLDSEDCLKLFQLLPEATQNIGSAINYISPSHKRWEILKDFLEPAHERTVRRVLLQRSRDSLFLFQKKWKSYTRPELARISKIATKFTVVGSMIVFFLSETVKVATNQWINDSSIKPADQLSERDLKHRDPQPLYTLLHTPYNNPIQGTIPIPISRDYGEFNNPPSAPPQMTVRFFQL